MEPFNGLKAIAVLISGSQSMIPRTAAFYLLGTIKNANSQIPPRISESETLGMGVISVLTSRPGDSETHSSLRTIGLHIMVEACS